MHRQAADRALGTVDRIQGVLDGGRKWCFASWQSAGPEDIQKLKIQHFIDVWSTKLGRKHNDIVFRCSDEEASYITPARDAMQVHSRIAESLDGEKCEVFVDAFAFVGGNTLAAMNQFRGSKIYSFEKSSVHKGRFKRLSDNIEEFKQALGGTVDVEVRSTDIKRFITESHGLDSISVLYLDPPRNLGSENVSGKSADGCQQSMYSSPAAISNFLKNNVFKPLKTKGIYPKIIALKLPGIPSFPSIEAIINQLGDEKYKQCDLCTPRNMYAVYIFRHITIDEDEEERLSEKKPDLQQPTPAPA
jgi:hypothetical protein